MKLRKLMAGTLAATMVVGSSMSVLAADANGATGTGTSFEHVDKEITSVTLPTESAVTNVFNYYVDPERAINDAKTLADGSTAVTPNEDGVYFAVQGDSGTTYASSSKAVEFTGKNSVDVDVTVAATVTAGDADKDITLVADEAALEAAATPALLMKLNVGTDSQAITASGATAKATIAGVADNFEVKGESGKFVFKEKTGVDASTWKKTSVQLVGKTNKKDIPTGANAMTTPTINLTWTVKKHVDSYISASTITASSNSVTLSLPSGVTLSKVEITYEDGTSAVPLGADQYAVADTTLTVPANLITAWTGLNPAFTKLVLTFSDDTSETITMQ